MRTAMVLGVIFFSFLALLAQAPPRSYACGLAYAQQPLDYKVDKELAECVVSNHGFDAVWAATTKAIMQLKWRVVSSDRAGGIMLARKSPKTALGTANLKDEELPGADLNVSETPDGVLVLVQWQDPRGAFPFASFKRDRNKFFAALFGKIAENLQ